ERKQLHSRGRYDPDPAVHNRFRRAPDLGVL
ncbi:MAG: hypothetical protein AVDCRST_MAG02-4700, partial [uncultured Rubrobacteraceae bacterium]